MPRIRTIKPEHKGHRKVGPLIDRHYRLWVGMITEADDEGRLVADADQLRVLIFAYHPRVRADHVEAGLARLAELGLIRLYQVAGVRYVDFPSWKDHQRINRPMPSKLPKYEDSLKKHGALSEDSVNHPDALTGDRKGSDQGSEAKGSDPKGGEREGNRGEEASMIAHATGSNNGQSQDQPLKRWDEAEELRVYGRCLSLLERLGRQPLPARVSER
jgi:hypothetical protein